MTRSRRKRVVVKKAFWLSVSALLALVVGVSYLVDNRQGSSSQVSIEKESSPRIDSLSVTSGPVGAEVVIYGDGFSFSKNYIKLGSGYFGYLTSSDGKTLMFSIPESITVGCGSADDFIEKNYVQCESMSDVEVSPMEYNLSVVTREGISNTVLLSVSSE